MVRARLSWGVFVLGGLVGFYWQGGAARIEPRWLGSLVYGYCFWCLFWALPAAWARRSAILAGIERWIPSQDKLVRWLLSRTLFAVGTCCFSVFGGGAVLCFRALRGRGRRTKYPPLGSLWPPGSSSGLPPSSP